MIGFNVDGITFSGEHVPRRTIRPDNCITVSVPVKFWPEELGIYPKGGYVTLSRKFIVSDNLNVRVEIKELETLNENEAEKTKSQTGEASKANITRETRATEQK